MLRAPAVVAGIALLLGACTTGVASSDADEAEIEETQPVEPSAELVEAEASTTTAESTTTTSSTTSTTTTTSTTVPETTTTSSTTSTTSTTTTTTEPEPELDVYDPACVVVIRRGDSLGRIAADIDDETVTVESLVRENSIANADAINAGSYLDVCVDNGLDDVNGEQRVKKSESKGEKGVIAQQEKLNKLFAGYGIRELIVDGISGPVTRQRLCAFRLAAGLPVTLTDMERGSKEEKALMRSKTLPMPYSTALNSDRWALIDMTCQVMFVGEGAESLRFVFNISTGEAGHGTRLQDRSPSFRYDPAAGNGGWHDSSLYPVSLDNPLNGNMYKPIYFDGGQAIHGANNVPTSPQSKGCVRTRVADQETLVAWLGLQDLTAPSWSSSQINLTVNAQGHYSTG